MDDSSKLLLQALACALHGESVPWEAGSVSSWPELRHLAAMHSVLPLLAQALWDSPIASAEPAPVRALAVRAKQLVTAQAQRTGDFLLLYRELRRRGLSPVVMKGIVCRSLFPCPDQRPSVDEDLLIPPDAYMAYHEAFLDLGFQLAEKDLSLQDEPEIPYQHPETHLYIELHKYPFPPGSKAYGDCNAPFANALDRAVPFTYLDTALRTLSPTDHMLFLICHAYKHFLHSGVGIRQLCDIGMFARHYDGEIDWPRVVSECASLRIEHMAAAMFRIAEQWLKLPMPAAFADLQTDEGPLLEDILTAGLYGTVDEDRLHSGTLTLDAVAAGKSGRKRRGLLATLFPSAGTLSTRYPYLRKRPWLLPFAWLQRAAGYLRKPQVRAGASMRIGEERIKLLRQYQVID